MNLPARSIRVWHIPFLEWDCRLKNGGTPMKSVFLSGLKKSFWIFPSILLFMSYTTANASAVTRAVQPATTVAQKSVSVPMPAFGKFIGTWYAHGAGISIHANGQAHFEARVYTWCGPNVARPCDSFQGNDIINGFKEDVQLARVAGPSAYGTVTSGNVHLIGSAVTIRLLPNDQLLFSVGKGSDNLLCGPHAPVGACGA
jgi:hypothetical protein